MWFDLSFAVLSAALLFVTFKLFERHGVDALQAIVVNYLCAAGLSFLAGTWRASGPADAGIPWAAPAVTGVLFMAVFYLIALTTRVRGLAVSTAAAKMSVVIPVAAGFTLYGEQPQARLVAGIVLAVAAVYFMVSGASPAARKAGGAAPAVLPLAVFAGSGVADASVKFTQHHAIAGDNGFVVMGVVFLTAGIAGAPFFVRGALKKRPAYPRLLAWGALLGLFNFFSLFFLFRCLARPGVSSALVFALLHAGVVVVCALAARTVFGERLTGRTNFGILVAVIALLLLTR